MTLRSMAGLFPADATSDAKSSASPITAHCDGGARGNPGPAGYGAVITDAAGHSLAELSEYLGRCTNNVAEYSGLLGCLAWTLEHRHTHLRVVSDSELMVKQIQGKYKVNSPDLRPLWQEARSRIAKLEHFEISHALRHKNKDADRLANEAMDRGTGKAASPASPSAGTGGAKSTGPARAVRGFTRDGVIHLLDNARLPDGIFVKVLPE
jgi:ribonuclease HI